MQIHILAFVLLIAYKRSSLLTYSISGVFILLQLLATISVILSGWGKMSIFHLYAFTFDMYVDIFNFQNLWTLIS